MNRSKRFLLIVLTTLLILSISIGCASKNMSRDIGVEDNAVSEESGSSRPDFGSDHSESEVSSLEPEKVITTISVYFETREFDETKEKLDDVIGKYKAYMENSNISHNQHYNDRSFRYGSFTIRVPSESVNEFKEELSGIGNMISENTNKEDVTKHYRDTESRLRVITTKEERILSLLEKAEKIEDIIALENQLSETIAEKESLKSNLLNIDDKVDFSTLYIEIQEVEKLSDTETLKTSFATRIKHAFSNSFFKFRKSLANLLIGIIYLLPYGLVFGLLAFFAYKIYIKLYNKKDKS